MTRTDRLRLRVFAPFRGVPAPHDAAPIEAAIDAERARAEAAGEAHADASIAVGQWVAACLAAPARAGVLFARDAPSCLRGLVTNEAVRRGWSSARADEVVDEVGRALRTRAANGEGREASIYWVIATLLANRGNAAAIVDHFRNPGPG